MNVAAGRHWASVLSAVSCSTLWKCLSAHSSHLPHKELRTSSSSGISSHDRFISLSHLNQLIYFLPPPPIFISRSSSYPSNTFRHNARILAPSYSITWPHQERATRV
ncbi:hypothetical protein B0H14DRAFT_2893097 [Mycena olivaceomarginata]|nr:hypothetical protein B0H14DRAFT_2893097 [Mycena olivaceomarginata]